jgi:hypothetical protein
MIAKMQRRAFTLRDASIPRAACAPESIPFGVRCKRSMAMSLQMRKTHHRAGCRGARSIPTHDARRTGNVPSAVRRDACHDERRCRACHATNVIARSVKRAESRSNALHPATMCSAVGHADAGVSSAIR